MRAVLCLALCCSTRALVHAPSTPPKGLDAPILPTYLPLLFAKKTGNALAIASYDVRRCYAASPQDGAWCVLSGGEGTHQLLGYSPAGRILSGGEGPTVCHSHLSHIACYISRGSLLFLLPNSCCSIANTELCVCVYWCVYACVHVCVCVYVCMPVRMYVCMYVCMYLFACIQHKVAILQTAAHHHTRILAVCDMYTHVHTYIHTYTHTHVHA
jgi:hypothetical protein